ncbi:hypothetical protein VNO77_41594 [Canavalia gladiata]|uniref:Uncharacterized protein n=1 Tax=Canavalia gladiata TaxID=3824 RepID=A0AAN9K179_CANGL
MRVRFLSEEMGDEVGNEPVRICEASMFFDCDVSDGFGSLSRQSLKVRIHGHHKGRSNRSVHGLHECTPEAKTFVYNTATMKADNVASLNVVSTSIGLAVNAFAVTQVIVVKLNRMLSNCELYTYYVMLRKIDSMDFMQTAPWLGLFPREDRQMLTSQNGRDSHWSFTDLLHGMDDNQSNKSNSSVKDYTSVGSRKSFSSKFKETITSSEGEMPSLHGAHIPKYGLTVYEAGNSSSHIWNRVLGGDVRLFLDPLNVIN